MSILGLDLNDAALTGVAAGELLFSEPGYAFATDGQLRFGADAWAQARRHPRQVHNRYWGQLSDDAFATSFGPAHSAADLVHDHLASLWSRYGEGRDGLALAIPAFWTPEQLGLLLGIAEELKLRIVGLVDASIAATRRQYPGRALLAIDSFLHGTAVTVLSQDGAPALGPRHQLPGLGIEALERAMVECIAASFVEAARFDPLHHADSEQFLFDHLYAWLAELARESRLTVELSFGGHEFNATLDRDLLTARVAEVSQPLLQQLRALLPADRPAALQLSGRLGDYPGMVSALATLPDVEVFLLDTAAAARGVCRESLQAMAGDGYRLLTSLPWDQPPVAAAAPAERAAVAGADRPTHLVFESRAYRLGDTPLNIGMELNPGGFGIQLSGRITGVSRQHCSLGLDNGRIVLTDHSRYGTRLNGHRIQGSAVLKAGDVISIGNPAREFVLVAETGADGA